ncbi:hypothetical protein PHSY_005146 [Pseudozyma hubeiensis SY62]|uniref:Uncharacterized protein n=1 Tax=Pseudozyma hubeiensis (strain SY62) TaxID=1305764 RepID=R9PHH2_PSEHS|nr:hypothetical protein PHSY_005146 [Pseudozyma hubeiensis SY62]GAC97560.1 hypothetical protein PHSY_005146 [Pseudozyma hubeiensis SY62]
MSRSLGRVVVVEDRVEVIERLRVCTGVTFIPSDVSILAGRLVNNPLTPLFSPLAAPESTEMSLDRKSSTIPLNTTASYAGVGSTELCFRSRLASTEPGVTVPASPPSDSELREDDAYGACDGSVSNGVRSDGDELRRVGKQHGKMVERNRSMVMSGVAGRVMRNGAIL